MGMAVDETLAPSYCTTQARSTRFRLSWQRFYHECVSTDYVRKTDYAAEDTVAGRLHNLALLAVHRI